MAQPTQNDIEYLHSHPDQAHNFEAAFGQGTAAQYLQKAQPSEADITYLKENPNAASKFDAQFGSGSSNRYLQSTLGSIASDVANGIPELPGAILRGAEQAVNETSDAAKSAGDYLNQHVADLGQITFKTDQNGLHIGYEHGTPKDNILHVPDAITPDAPQTITGNIAEGVSQFTTGMIGAGKFLKAFGIAGEAASTVGKFVRTAGQAALADATVFDPHQQRLSNLVQTAPYLQNPVTDFLSAKPTDSEAEGRFKNALEGFLTGATLEGFVKGVKALKLAREGKTMEAADVATEAEVKAAPEQPVATTSEPPTSTPAPSEAAPEAATQAEPKLAFALSPEELQSYRDNLAKRQATDVPLEQKYGITPVGSDFNFEKISSTADVKAVINAMGDTVGEHINALKGGEVESWDHVKQAADDIATITGGDPSLMLQNVHSLHQSTQGLAGQMKAYRDFLVSLGDHHDQLANMMVSGTHGEYGSMDALAQAYAHSTNLLANTYGMLKGIQTNVARALNAQKMMAGSRADFVAGLKGVDPEDMQALKAMAQRQVALNDIEDPIAKAAAQRQLLEGTALDKTIGVHNEYWFNAVLSGVKTHVVNMTANALNAALYPAERMIGGLIGGNDAMFKEGAYQYAGMAKSFKDALKAASRSFQISDNVLDYRGPYAGIHKDFINAATLGQEGTSIAPLINGLGTIVRIPSRFLMAEDEFFKQLAYRGRVYAQAMRDGNERGLAGEALAQHVEAQMNNAFSPEGAALNPAALQQAREVTFTQPLDYGIGKWLESGAQAHPGLRLLVPFVRVPTNIGRFIWQHTPGLGFLQRQLKEDIAAGGERANMAYAKQATGAMLSASATMLAYEGCITGYGPTDPDLRKQWLQDNQPYSFVFHGADGKKTFISYQRLDPYSSFLGIAADMAYQSGQWSDEDYSDIAYGLAAAVAQNVTSKTYLQGITQTLDAVQAKDPYAIEAWFKQRAASYIPNALDVVHDDPYMREVRGLVDAMGRKVPGISNTLPASRDLLGEKMMAPMGYPFTAINPFVVKQTDGDPVRVELARLAGSEGGHAFTLPSKKIGPLDLTQVYNDGGKTSAWDRWQELIGETRIGGKTLHERLANTIQTPAYQNASDGNSEFSKSRKVDMIYRDIEHYRKVAMEKMLREYPDLHTALLQYKRQSSMVKAGQAPQSDPFAILKQ